MRRSSRLRAVGWVSGLLVASCAAACGSSTTVTTDGGTDGDPGACPADTYRCLKTGACEPVQKVCKQEPSCAPYQEIDYGPGPDFMDPETCEPIPQDCACKDRPPLVHGPLGRHSALAASGDRLLASAYESKYGDLVLVSTSLSDLATTTKEIIDGVPDGQPIASPAGYRGGVAAAGDDVGLHSDIAVTAGGVVIVSYHDATHRSLKVALRPADGQRWNVHTVAAPADDREIVARHTALSLAGDIPELAFLVLNRSDGTGLFTAELRWARATKAQPAAAADWDIDVIDSAPMPCRNLCASNQACFVNADGTSQCRTRDSNCPASCGDDTACLAGSCVDVLADRTYVEVPVALGLWPAIVRGSAGPLVVYHDGVAGNLKAASLAGSSWTAATVLGDDGDHVGAFCSAAIDPDGQTIHVAHQDAVHQTLHYVQVEVATLAATAPATIDDGVRSDGVHQVGADSAIVVAPSGEIRVVYQDQLNADLLTARRTADGQWMPLQTSDPDLGRMLKGGPPGYGFYSDMVVHQGQVYGSTFFFDTQSESGGDLAFFTVP